MRVEIANCSVDPVPAARDADAIVIDVGHELVGEISNERVHHDGLTVPVRRYRPKNAKAAAGVVYMHGGGWVLGDLDTSDHFARAIARTLEVTVISVDYRRAPEHPFPAPLNDCIAVAAAAKEEFVEWCAPAGDSVGGILALGVALSGNIGDFDAQLLLYPCLDAAMSETSHDRFADGFGLTKEAMKYFWAAYAGQSATNDLFAPIETLRLSNLPFMTLPRGFIETVNKVEAAEKAVGLILESLKH